MPDVWHQCTLWDCLRTRCGIHLARVLAALGLGGAPSIAVANPLFGFVGNPNTGQTPARIDPSSGVATEVANFAASSGTPIRWNLAYDPTNTTLYGIQEDDSVLSEINVTTHADTIVSVNPSGLLVPGNEVSGLAIADSESISSSVPEPPAALLYMTGLAGLISLTRWRGLISRRRRQRPTATSK